MTEPRDIVSVKLMDREYNVKCPPEKIADLQEAALYLDSKMREVSDGGKILSIDRILVIAALNTVNDLITQKRQKNIYIDMISKRIQEIQNKIDDALAEKNSTTV